jgi:Winged helix DNA-binding domain
VARAVWSSGVAQDAEQLSLAALNRALLARQGLLERLDAPLVEAVEAIGALQAQHWPAPPVALWSRVKGFAPADLYAALERGDLVIGTLLRTTLHLVSAREHAAYAAVAAEVADWRRSKAEASAEARRLPDALVAHARRTARTSEDLAARAEEWVEAHPKALHRDEVDAQRSRNWRALARWHGFVRVPEDGEWGTKSPAALRAAPKPSRKLAVDTALDEVIRRHLRAFGPASADDVASWINWRPKPVREAFARLEGELARFEDEGGRALYDLPDAPRPDPSTPAPPRLLAPFDSILLAYASKHRARILPDAHRDSVYERKNLRIRPSYTVDGLVAGTWDVEVKRGEAILALRPLEKLPRAARSDLVDEAERLARAMRPDAKGHRVVVER